MNGAIATYGAVSRNEPSVTTAAELEDILYDILATGVAPSPVPGALEAVQALLHEHARRHKSPAELLAFFDRYGLPRTQERIVAAVPTALPEPAAAAPRARGAEPQALLEAPQGADVMAAFTPSTTTRSRALTWSLAASALILLGVAVGLGYTALRDVQAQLALARQEAHDQAATLSEVQREATHLRRELSENVAVVQRVDEKSDLLLQTFASPLDPAQR